MARRRPRARLLRSLAAGASGLLWIGVSAHAQPPDAGPDGPGHGPGHGIERMLERNADRLGLDAATRDRIRALAEDSRKVSDPLRAERDRLRDELRAMLSAETPDLDAVLAKADEIGTVDTQLHKQRLRTLFAIRALLTPEQRRELVRLHEERRAEWGERRGRWGPDRWHDSSERE